MSALAAARSSEWQMTGWGRLARLHLRTFRRRLILWPLLIGVLVLTTAQAVAGLYDTPAKRAAYAATAGASAAAQAFNGRGHALDTAGGITAYELGFYVLLVFPAIAVHLAIHLTRSQEAAGRLDLLAAGRLGRRAPLLAAAVVLLGVLGVAAAISGAALAGFVGGGWLYAAGLLGLLLLFAAVGLISAQIAADSYGAHSWGLGIVGGLYLVRAIIDGLDLPLTWVTPFGWFDALRPFDTPDPAPLLALFAGALVLGVVAIALRERRDLGSGLVAARPGPRSGGALLRSPAGMVARLLRGAWIGWLFAAVLWGFTIGMIADQMRDLVESNPAMQEMLGSKNAAPEDLMLSVGGFFLAALGIGFAAQAATRLAGEETSGRLAGVLATRVSRRRWWLSGGLVVGLGAVSILLISAGAMGLGVAMATGRSSAIADGFVLGGDFVTAVLLSVAIALLALSADARFAAFGWVLFGVVTTIQFLGETLNLPEWVINLSPLHHVGQPPIDPANTMALVVLGVTALALAVGSVVLFRRRDLAH